MSGEQIKPGYKLTDVGVIPDDWKVKRLGELTQDTKNIRYGIVQPGKFNAGGCFMLRSQDYSKGWVGTDGMHQVTAELEQQFKNARLGTNDLVMTVVGAGIGQVVTIPDWLDGAILSRSTARIAIDKKKSEPTFVKDFLESSVGKRQLIDCQKEGAQPVVSCPDLAKFLVPIPTLSEQHVIATALTDIDALLTKLDQLIAKKRDLKQATMQQLLTGQTRLPGFSGEWEVKRLGDVASLYQPTTISASVFTKDGHPVYGANGIVGYYHAFNHEEPQVTVTCRGSTCGTVNMTAGKSWITGNAMVVNCDDSTSIEKDFLYQLLLHQDLSVCITGSGQPQIVRGPLANFDICIPLDREEQTAIANFLSIMDAELATLEARRDKARTLKQGMMQELLTGKIRLI